MSVQAPAAGLLPVRYEGMHRAYPELVDAVVRYGERVLAPTGRWLYELRAVSFTIEDAVNRGVPLGCGRKVGRVMQTLDGAQNLAGVSVPDLAIALAPTLARFSDTADGVRVFHGAYGPRLGPAMPALELQLRRDRFTKRAVVNLWDESDRQVHWKDRPCTTHFQLYQVADRLDMHVSMRANDVFTGTCYDVFQFGQIQAAMAHVLGMPVGAYHHHAVSLHAYETDLERLADVRAWVGDSPAVDNPRESWGPAWCDLPAGTWTRWVDLAADFQGMLAAARKGAAFEPSNVVLEWYWQRLRPATDH